MIVVHPWGIDDGQGWRTPRARGRRVPVHARQEQDRPRPRRDGDQPVPQGDAGQGRRGGVQPARPRGPHPQEALSLVPRPARRAGARAGPSRARGQARVLQLSGPGPPLRDHRRGRGADGRLLPPVPRPRRRGGLRRTGVLGPADPRDEIDRGRPARRRDLRRRGLSGAPRFPQAAGHPARPAGRLQHGYVRLLDDGRLQEPVAGLRRVPRGRRDHRHLPGPPHAAVRHDVGRVLRRAQPVHHPGVVGPPPVRPPSKGDEDDASARRIPIRRGGASWPLHSARARQRPGRPRPSRPLLRQRKPSSPSRSTWR